MKLLNKTAGIIFSITMVTLVATADFAFAEDKPEADLTVSFLSQYVWRGFELSKDSLVIQPSMTVSHKGFGFNFWGNLDTDTYITGTNKFNETNLVLSYDGSVKKFGYAAGYIYYGLEGLNDLQEIYLTASYAVITSPTFTIYREITGVGEWYGLFEISHTFNLGKDMGLDLGASVGYLDTDTYNEFHDGKIWTTMSIPVSEYVTIVPELYYSFALSSEAETRIQSLSFTGNDDNFVYGGVSVSFTF